MKIKRVKPSPTCERNKTSLYDWYNKDGVITSRFSGKLYFARREHLQSFKYKVLCRLASERIWLSGKTLDCRPRDCEFNPPSLQLKLLKRRYVLVLPRKHAPVYQCFTLGTLKNLVCHVWWALQYLALWATYRN